MWEKKIERIRRRAGFSQEERFLDYLMNRSQLLKEFLRRLAEEGEGTHVDPGALARFVEGKGSADEAIVKKEKGSTHGVLRELGLEKYIKHIPDEPMPYFRDARGQIVIPPHIKLLIEEVRRRGPEETIKKVKRILEEIKRYNEPVRIK